MRTLFDDYMGWNSGNGASAQDAQSVLYITMYAYGLAKDGRELVGIHLFLLGGKVEIVVAGDRFYSDLDIGMEQNQIIAKIVGDVYGKMNLVVMTINLLVGEQQAVAVVTASLQTFVEEVSEVGTG